MNIGNYFIKEKSETQKTKDAILENMMKQQGLYDMYYLGQISIVEGLINYIDKEYCNAILKGLINASETSDEIKKLASDLVEKYNKEPKYEL